MLLNEILEEYKDSEDKQKIIDDFIDTLWKSKYTYKKYKKYFTYDINENILSERKDLIQLFEKYQLIDVTFCKSYYKKRMDYIDYIRIHINNMYGFLVDKDVYLPKEYYKSLLTPKNEYFKAIKKIKNGEDVSAEEIEEIIIDALEKAKQVKTENEKRKLNIKHKDYKKLINGYISRIFENYIPLHEYEQTHGWDMNVDIDGWSENNYIIRYFCKSLTGYLRNYIRDGKPKEVKQKKCVVCRKDIISNSNRQKYCDECWNKINREQIKKRVRKHRKNDM